MENDTERMDGVRAEVDVTHPESFREEVGETLAGLERHIGETEALFRQEHGAEGERLLALLNMAS